MARPRHPNKEIEDAIQLAEGHGWRVVVGGSHVWGILYCPEDSRDGHRFPVYSTPRVPFAHAKDLRRAVNRCRHVPPTSPPTTD
ncbi:MAG: hypothetical protein LC745_08015 [Planctomycetia bacterium]|nr:hypothetical protein [Planctomycetia bacterium]